MNINKIFIRNIVIITSLVIISTSTSFALFDTMKSYEEQIKEQGRNIVKSYIEKEKNEFLKNDNNLEKYENQDNYKKYIAKLISRKGYNPGENDNDKILYEYERIINTELIPASDPTTVTAPINKNEVQ